MLNKEAWSSQESKNLFKIARKHEERDWAKIARELGVSRRTVICDRYNYLQYNNIIPRCAQYHDNALAIHIPVSMVTAVNYACALRDTPIFRKIMSRLKSKLSEKFELGPSCNNLVTEPALE